jgi:hypothetical protein
VGDVVEAPGVNAIHESNLKTLKEIHESHDILKLTKNNFPNVSRMFFKTY